MSKENARNSYYFGVFNTINRVSYAQLGRRDTHRVLFVSRIVIVRIKETDVGSV